MMGSEPVPEAVRKRVLRVVFISLLLDLISFTFILPLFPRLLEFYRDLDLSTGSQNTLLAKVLDGLNAYKNSFERPINSRYDIVLLGGALGSLFSLCQAIASPIIGSLSDRYGRRRALLCSMVGNIASVALWVVAVDFRTFVASRVVGGLSEGNVQLATAIATDVSSPETRGATMALVGACFSVAFTLGPALGAWLAGISNVANNPFATAAGFSLCLILAETLYIYIALPETLPELEASGRTNASANAPANGHVKVKGHAVDRAPPEATTKSSPRHDATMQRTNPRWLLNMTHFLFILFFSGMEFSLPFMTWDLFRYSSAACGRLLGYMGLVASLLQGGVVRRMHPLNVVKLGVLSCTLALFLLGRIETTRGLYGAATLLAITSATVVTGLNSLSSFEAAADERGTILGNHRSWGMFWSISLSLYLACTFCLTERTGQLGRALGPLLFCTLYWWAGRQIAYMVGSVGMLAVLGLVYGTFKLPVRIEDAAKSGQAK